MRYLVDDLAQEFELPVVSSETVFGDEPFRAEELRSLYEDAHGDVIAICSPGGLVGYVSPACQTTLGWEPAALVGRALVDFVHPDDLPAIKASHSSALLSPMAFSAMFRFRCRDGRYLWTEGVIRQIANPRAPGALLLMVSMRDVADRKLAEVELEGQAFIDPLTGIATRTVFMDRLALALLRLERSDTVLAVIYLDLDRFKVINDSLGHEVGDRLLMKVAERAAATIRPADTLARLGGDEFVVLAEGLGAGEVAKRLAARVCESMEVPFDLEGESIVCTTSAGVATTTDFGHSALGLLQEANLALSKAKNRGRNRAEEFDEELRTTAVGRLAAERMIRSAVEEKRLLVRYQPIVDLHTGHVVQVEALLRITQHDAIVLPEVFIDVAEETGLLVAIDESVLSQAVTQAATWARELPVTDFGGVAINVTGRHLSDSRFVQVVADALAANELAPGALAIEVTERVLMEASNSAMDCLRTIRELGVPVGLDDFGTGYSSLAYLRQFPLDFLKIDQSFIRQLQEGAENLAIVTAIIQLAHALDLSVVAEGVETAEQLQILTRLRCDRAQGFLFGRAEDPGAIAALVEVRSKLSPVCPDGTATEGWS